MKQPLFSVGEKVICQLKYYPKASGEYYITEILTPAQFEKEFPSFETSNQNHYRLDKFCTVGDVTGHKTDCVRESSLRKIHKPSQFSFDQLISEIKCPLSITQ